MTSPWWGLRGQSSLTLTTLDRWKRHFREQSYIENYSYLLKSTKSTKIFSQKCWRNIIWADFFECPYRPNGIKTRLGSPVIVCIGVSTPPQKHHHLLSCQAPLKSANYPSPPFFRQSSPIYWFFVNPSLKIGFFNEPLNY